MARRRFTREEIELFEALAPDANEILAKLGKMSDAELEKELVSVKSEEEAFLRRVRLKFGKN